MLVQETIKITSRNFRNNKTASVIKILGLAISMTAVVIIWAFVINENKFDKGIPDSDRIFRLEAHWASMPAFIGHMINQNFSGEISAVRINFSTDVGIQVNNTPFNLKNLAFADSTFFKVFQLESIEGDLKEALNQPFSLVLTESSARRFFGSTDIVGKTVRFENQVDFTVKAVIKDYPYLHFKLDVLASIVSLEQIAYKGILQAYDGWNYPTYLVIPDSKLAKDYESRIKELLAKFHYNSPFRLHAFDSIFYSPEIENESNTRHGNILYNRILISISVFIMLLAAINFINLTIANAVSRSKEVSLKKIQGASYYQLISQFMLETVIFILISVGLSILLLWFLDPLLNSVTGLSVNFSDFYTHGNLFRALIGLLLFIVISGIYPSIYISSYNINSNKKIVSGRSEHLNIRNGLILFQNLVSVTLICCTLIANRQFVFINKTDLGFSKKGVVNLKLNSQLKEHMDLLKERLVKNPEILSVSFSSRIPGNYWGSWCCVKIEGKENKYFNNYVDADYLKTMGISIKEGRNFSRDNLSDIKTTYLINETAIRLYDLKNPIGQVILPGNGVKGQIIGIINDFHYRGLNYEQTPLLLFYTPDYLNYVNIKINENNVPGALEKIRVIWNDLCPAFAFEYTFLDETYDLQYKSERRFENLLFSFALLAVFIASIGLFGLSIYTTERRIKEIGIRKVNGASVSGIMVMLNKDFLKWVVIAFVLSCPVAWYAMQKWLKNFAYKTELSWWIFALAGLIAVGIAFLTVSIQSWRAATRNPVEALRYE